ncbi:hypothetical protein Ngar_c22520 [Candidatus Nitrososphaera gargensis Ga9.2]|uniref:Uncharacterized protein n=1 Tax=Nitrososphaera gargensis (strain Ga9.2) TaxID=1237085 RepID=K0IKW4_NITGG|nr:hypothetical protein Ngar_c22520 [Candidatus Nitrososphaera gargensis Ga9.2]
MGISPEKCSDIEILKHRCLDGPNSPCSMGRPPLPPKLAPFILSILTGYGIALVTGVYAVRKIRKVRKKATTE